MTGFTTDYVNQIAINLRGRYKSGFPILKELVQNADDAGAKSLAFGFHAGRIDRPVRWRRRCALDVVSIGWSAEIAGARHEIGSLRRAVGRVHPAQYDQSPRPP